MVQRVVILGAPGVGKGTQAKKIKEKYGCIHVSTGDILRNEIEHRTVLGNKVDTYVKKGELVPDDIIIKLIKKKLKDDSGKGFIFDGFPRNVVQAEKLDGILSNLGLHLTAVVLVNVSNEEIIKRISRRYLCDTCGPVIIENNNSEKKCSNCGKKVQRRKDDEPETVKHRLKVFENQTRSLINYYKGRNLFKSIDGMGSVNDIFQRIETVLDVIQDD